MHHRLPAVDDDPLAVGLTFKPWLGEPSLANCVGNTGGQCLGLPVGGARRHNHPLKQRGQVLSVKHFDVLGFHIFQAVHDDALEFLNIFFSRGGSSHQWVW